ncbi:16790_t:CDS:2, partial [Rhizophagus irregularis]
FNILKSLLDKIKEVFVHSPARRGRYLAYLKMHGISSPCKIPLYNKTQEFDNDKKHVTLMAINSCLQNEKESDIITIYLNFISFYAKEFIQDLDFFQQLNKPIFPLVELRLQQLTSYIK